MPGLWMMSLCHTRPRLILYLYNAAGTLQHLRLTTSRIPVTSHITQLHIPDTNAMSAGPQRDTLTSRLSSTFWLLLNTPMIPPEENVESQAVQMTDFPDTRGAHPHEKTVRLRSVE